MLGPWERQEVGRAVAGCGGRRGDDRTKQRGGSELGIAGARQHRGLLSADPASAVSAQARAAVCWGRPREHTGHFSLVGEQKAPWLVVGGLSPFLEPLRCPGDVIRRPGSGSWSARARGAYLHAGTRKNRGNTRKSSSAAEKRTYTVPRSSRYASRPVKPLIRVPFSENLKNLRENSETGSDQGFQCLYLQYLRTLENLLH